VAGGVHDDEQHLGRAEQAVKRVAIGCCALLAGVGLAAAYLELWRHHAPTIRGTTATEYLPTQPPPKPPAPGLAWPTYGYDQERTRASPSITVRPPFRRVWTFHGRSLLEFPPVVGYGRVFLTTFDGRLTALDAVSGTVVWRYRSGRCGWASPALAGHVVYETFIGSRECDSRANDGQVAAFAAGSGRRLWLRRIGPTESSPLVADGAVYVGDWDGRVWALDAATGRTRWVVQLHGAIKGSLALSGGRLFIGTYGGDVVALSAIGGRTIWRSGGHGRIYSSPAVAYGRVYIGSLDGGVYAFGAGTGHLLWAHATGGYVYASPAVWRKRILVGSYNHHFYAFDAGTGDIRWRFDGNGPISGSASVIDGLVYFSTFAGRTYALRVADGAQVTTLPDGKYSPAVADRNQLYFVGLGKLYALKPRR
jgi:outer membrane protein assembly factor BamB